MDQLEQLNKIYLALSRKGEIGRGIFMRDKEWNICYEPKLETEPDYSMPECAMVCAACEPKCQIKEINRKTKKNCHLTTGSRKAGWKNGSPLTHNNSGIVFGNGTLGRKAETFGVVSYLGEA